MVAEPIGIRKLNIAAREAQASEGYRLQPSFQIEAQRLYQTAETWGLVTKKQFPHLYIHFHKDFEERVTQYPWDVSMPSKERVVYRAMRLFSGKNNTKTASLRNSHNETPSRLEIDINTEHADKTHTTSKGFELRECKNGLVKAIPASYVGAIFLEDFSARMNLYAKRQKEQIHVEIVNGKWIPR